MLSGFELYPRWVPLTGVTAVVVCHYGITVDDSITVFLLD